LSQDSSVHPEVTGSRSRANEVLAVAAVGAVILLCFSPFLFGSWSLLSFDERMFPPFHVHGEVHSGPQNLVTTDLQGWVLSDTEISIRALKELSVPLWDSSMLLGRPLHATGSFPTFYPPDWLYALFEPVRGYAVSMAFHFLWMALGFFGWMRTLRCSVLASAVAGLSFGLSGWSLVHLHIPHFVRSISWIPWCLLCCERLSNCSTAPRAAQLSVCIGMLALCAFPPVLGVGLFAVGFWALRCFLGATRRGHFAAMFAGASVLGILLAAVELVPLLELRKDSMRSAAIDQDLLEQKSLHPLHLVSLVAPDFQGNPVRLRELGLNVVESDYPIARRMFPRDVQNNYVENTLYCGIAVLLLAGLGALGVRRGPVLWVMAWIVLGLLFAFQGPLQELARAGLIPGFSAGSPKRALLLCALGWPALAGFGLDALKQDPAGQRRRFLVLCGVLALVLTLLCGWLLFRVSAWTEESKEALAATRRELIRAFAIPLGLVLTCTAILGCLRSWGRTALAALVAVLLGDLLWFGVQFNPPQPPGARGATTSSIERLLKPGNEGRVLRHPARELMAAPIVSRFGVRSVDGIQPLVLREPAELLEAFHPGVIDPQDPWYTRSFANAERLRLPLLRLLARWIVASVDLSALGFPMRQAFEAEGLALFEVPGALPDAALFTEYEVIADKDQRLKRLTDPAFEPDLILVLEEAPSARYHTVKDSPAKPRVNSHRVDSQTFRVDVSTADGGMLWINEAFHRGWRARIDGQPARVLRADHAFMTIEMPKGDHHLELRYAPFSFQLGLWLSVLALLVVMVTLISPRGRGMRRAQPAASLGSANSLSGSR